MLAILSLLSALYNGSDWMPNGISGTYIIARAQGQCRGADKNNWTEILNLDLD